MESIAIFDSGKGGLSVLNLLQRIYPEQNFIYFADYEHLPYGNKTQEQILKYSTQICQWLDNKGISLIIAACHTSSLLAITSVRDNITSPIIGMHTALASFLKKSPYQQALMLATPTTASSKRYPEYFKASGVSCQVDMLPCPGLVELIEQKESKAIDAYLNHKLGTAVELGYDAILLGCTHYELIHSQISKSVSQSIDIITIDSWLPKFIAPFVKHGSKKKGSTQYFYTKNKSKRFDDLQLEFEDVTI